MEREVFREKQKSGVPYTSQGRERPVYGWHDGTTTKSKPGLNIDYTLTKQFSQNFSISSGLNFNFRRWSTDFELQNTLQEVPDSMHSVLVNQRRLRKISLRIPYLANYHYENISISGGVILGLFEHNTVERNYYIRRDTQSSFSSTRPIHLFSNNSFLSFILRTSYQLPLWKEKMALYSGIEYISKNVIFFSFGATMQLNSDS